MLSRGTSAEALDGSVGDGALPVSPLTIHHFVLRFLYFKTSFCFRTFDKALAPADRSHHAPSPPIEKLICGVICQPKPRLLSNCDKRKASLNRRDFIHRFEKREEAVLNDDVVAVASNIIVPLSVHRGVSERVAWRTASCPCPQQYVWLAGQLQTGNCILNLDNTILICSSCQCEIKQNTLFIREI